MDKSFPKNMLSHALVLLGSAFLASSYALAEISIDQQPIAPTKPVPANVAIVGSFEFPTMVTNAYKDDKYYNEDGSYLGYFDNRKCYGYHYEEDETQRHFFPVNNFGPLCADEELWSGNFLNWATMQTIDIFRHVLTGGYRSTDTEGVTLLEKGRQTGQGNDNNFPVRTINKTKKMQNAAPYPRWSTFNTRIGQSRSTLGLIGPNKYPELGKFGNKMRFSDIGRLQDWADRTKKVTIYKGGKLGGLLVDTEVFELSVRVKVCVDGLLEDNCVKQKKGNYKPVGLIQKYAETEGTPRMRFSAFGYLNDPSEDNNFGDNRNRKGGVMHARMKYVGLNSANDQNIAKPNNPNAEWDEYGIFTSNPDPLDASATLPDDKVKHSGVISYLNRSGNIVDGTQFKYNDNVSELYYTAYRYMKGLNNIPAYSDLFLPKSSDTTLEQLVGGLPVIKDWKNQINPESKKTISHDPIQFSCQKNFIIGIGDTLTANDWGLVEDAKNHNDWSLVEDEKNHKDNLDPLFKGDNFKNLRENMHSREKITSEQYTKGKRGSDYIAVLAYDANTADLRPEMTGTQSVSTYWIDVLEDGLKPKETNPYWMAAKYGGFKVPEQFEPMDNENSISESLWWTSGDNLETNNKKIKNKRPDNFFAASDPKDIIDSLNQVFKSIQLDQSGADGSIAISDVDSDADLMTFQSRYISGSWTGNLYGYKIDPTTQLPKNAPEWDAESKLPNWSSRNVYINSSTFKKLDKDASNINGLTKDQVNYLLGDRSKETDGSLRRRTAILGDIVNSEPVYVGRPRVDAFSTRSFTGMDKYLKFAQDNASRHAVVYVGGNDGMLHGFDAKTGVEKFAFIPATVVANNLASLTDKNYLHRYSVDGEISVADVYINSTWKTILVGTLGAGGVATDRKTVNNAVFALDITDPDPEKISLLWEKTSEDIPALGITLGKPSIIQNDKGQWKVVLGNGPNSNNNTTSLISIDFFGGSVTTTELDSGSGANGLSALRTWDSTGDGRTDTLYAGDFKGQLWKITNLSDTPKAIKLFTAVDKEGVAQPITSVPLAGVSPYDRTTWLFFGTGRYLSVADVVDTQLQTWYGIKDNGKKQQTRNTLLERHIIAEQNVSAQGDITVARVLEKGSLDELVNKQGWFIDLYRIIKGDPDKYTEDKINGKPTINGERAQYGERMVHSNQFKDRALISNTVVPNAQDACAPYGSGMIMAINPFTGGRLDDTFFDVNKDGDFTSADEIMFGKNAIPVSGISIKTGTSSPTFLGNTMLSSEPTGQLPQTINPYLGDALKPSWRELINREN